MQDPLKEKEEQTISPEDDPMADLARQLKEQQRLIEEQNQKLLD